MNTRDLLIYLRDQLLEAHRTGNIERLNSLFIAIPVISDAAYVAQEKQDRLVPHVGKGLRITGLLDDLECLARDYLSGVDWKGEVPTDEDIDKALAN